MSTTRESESAFPPERIAELRAVVDGATIPFAPAYSVTRDGSVLSSQPWRGTSTRTLRPVADRHGYLRVHLQLPSGRRTAPRVHRLVALAFLGPKPSPDHQIRHLDGDKSNNDARNLAWGTAAENAEDRERHGRTARGLRNGVHTKPETRVRGDRVGTSKLVESDVVAIRALARSGLRAPAIAPRFGVCASTIYHILSGASWSHVPADVLGTEP